MSKYMVYIIIALQMTVALRSKVQVCGPSSAGIVVSNPVEGTDDRIPCVVLRITQVAVSKTSRSFLHRNSMAYVCFNCGL
jgi:hypothetical protein